MKIKVAEKTYEQTKMKGRAVRKYLTLQQELKGFDDDSPEILDKVFEFIVDFYGGKFTTEDLEDEDIKDIMDNYKDISIEIGNKMNKSTEKYEKN